MNQLRLLSILLLICLVTSLAKGQDNECIERFSVYDTISAHGNFIKYHIKGNIAQLEYGNKSFRKILPEKYDCNLADSRIPRFKWDNDDFICIRYGCGSPCWGVLILPLNPSDSVRKIMYDLASDPKDNLIVYLNQNDYKNLMVENLQNKSVQEIVITQKCSSVFIGYCIDSISVNKDELYYRFVEPNIIDKPNKSTEYRVKIK